MIRQHENSVAFKAGMLSFGVHAILIIAMLVSFSWHTPQPVSIAEVELWENLPVAPTVVPPKPLPEPLIKKEEPKPLPKPEPEPEPKVKEEPKADIQLENKRKEEEKRKVEEKRKEEQKKQAELDKLKKQMLLEEKLEKQEALKEKQRQEALRKLQQDMLADEDAKAPKASTAKSSSTASAGEVDKYKAMIQAKIQRNVNQSLCGNGDPELVYEIALMPTGDVQGTPKLVKSSGLPVCDDAVERAILQSQPLPLPTDPDLRAEFRNLKLKFHPNE
jgi:colicin import membrane protein